MRNSEIIQCLLEKLEGSGVDVLAQTQHGKLTLLRSGGGCGSTLIKTKEGPVLLPAEIEFLVFVDSVEDMV